MSKDVLSISAAFDDLVRCTNVLINGGCEEEFLIFAQNQEECRLKWLSAVEECRRLAATLEEANILNRDLEKKMLLARRLLDKERKKRVEVERERDVFESHLMLVRELVMDRGAPLGEEARERLSFLSNTLGDMRRSGHTDNIRLDTISERLDSTGSLLSDYSYSRSEDDLDMSVLRPCRAWKKHRPSQPRTPGEGPETKRSRPSPHEVLLSSSSGGLVATTTVTVPADGGPVTAHSRVETHTPPQTARRGETHTTPQTARLGSVGMELGRPSVRAHVFYNKTILRADTCGPCGKRIKFGKIAVKCRDCRATSHPECRDLVPLPCIHVGNTPTLRGATGSIADYTPINPPWVPSLVVHCVNEVEARGLGEVGLYRVPGSDRDVKGLKEKFLRGKGPPNLSQLDIHVVCGSIKDFLRSLAEPLVTQSLRPSFVAAVELNDREDVRAALYQTVAELPGPNRDTMAFLMLHLQRVAECLECKMPIGNLAKVFGPTLVGFSSDELEPAQVYSETHKQAAVVENLLCIPADYWHNFVSTTPHDSAPLARPLPRQDSGTFRGYFQTPLGTRDKRRRYFATPPLKP